MANLSWLDGKLVVVTSHFVYRAEMCRLADSLADYIGCMKNGDVYSDPKYRWYEELWLLLGKTYFTHAWGTLYVLSKRAVMRISAMPDGALRFFNNEGLCLLQDACFLLIMQYGPADDVAHALCRCYYGGMDAGPKCDAL